MWRREASQHPDWRRPDCGQSSAFRMKNQDCCCRRIADIPVRWSSACEIQPDCGVRTTRFPATCPELSDLRWWAMLTTIPGNRLLREQAAPVICLVFDFYFVHFFSDCFCYEFFEGSRQRWCGLNQTKTEMKEKDKKEHWVTIILLSLQIHTSKSTII